MTIAPEPAISGCVSVDFGPLADILLAVGLIAIPATAILLIARIARRNPSRELVLAGRRQWGVRLRRWGLVMVTGAAIGFTAAIWIAINETGSCDDTPSGLIAFISIASGIVGALVVGGGWAIAIRAVWVVFATLATVDIWIFYISLLIGLDDPDAIAGLLLLAFAIHAICIALAARWSFAAKDLGPIERAKAGEAGRTLSAVWVFLASYTALALFRNESGIFSTAAGSAVIGALTLGALAATMGSGFTKYAEAIHAKPATPPSIQTPTESPMTVAVPGATATAASPMDSDAPGDTDDNSAGQSVTGQS
jgi:hypothetical protein